MDIPDAGDRIEDILGQALRLPALDGSREGYLTILDVDLDTGGVEHAVMGQVFADIFLDSGIATLIALWTAATVGTSHPASGSRVTRAALPARAVAVTLGTYLPAPVFRLLLPPGAASTDALTATGALAPVAARTLLPVAPFAAVTFLRAHGTWSGTTRIGTVRTLPTAILPFAAILPLSWWPLLPVGSSSESLIVVILMVLPADTLASVVLAVALIAILGDALITELSLGAIAVASKLALPFAAGPTAIVSSVLDPGASAARSPLVIRIVTVAVLGAFVPVHAAAVAMLMVVV